MIIKQFKYFSLLSDQHLFLLRSVSGINTKCVGSKDIIRVILPLYFNEFVIFLSAEKVIMVSENH